MSWLGTAFQIVGVFMLSSNLFNMPLTFAIMNVGSIIWLVLVARRKEWPLVALNAVYVISNTIGMLRWA